MGWGLKKGNEGHIFAYICMVTIKRVRNEDGIVILVFGWKGRTIG